MYKFRLVETEKGNGNKFVIFLLCFCAPEYGMARTGHLLCGDWGMEL